jgi:hypothetical protein
MAGEIGDRKHARQEPRAAMLLPSRQCVPKRRISIILLPRNQPCLRQTHSSELSPKLRSALDSLSNLMIQGPVRCDRCGSAMIPVNARLRLHGGQGQWNFRLPLCGGCDYEALEALSSPVQAMKQSHVSETKRTHN